MLAILFPAIDPIAIQIGPLAIRWYALAYLIGFVAGWRYCIHLARKDQRPPTAVDFDDFLTWAVVGVVLGGRLGYVLFYNTGYYLNNPLEALAVWHGGMSFHGGMLGVIAAIFLFAHKRGFSPLALGDLISCAVPIGLFFGRITNFVNAELWGRVTDVPWGVIFPGERAGGLPRHPSQLYEAALEGLMLFVVLAILARRPSIRNRPGTLGGVFLAGYGLSRIVVEYFREPDPQLGFLLGGHVTMGQILSVPMVIVGLALIVIARRRGELNRESGSEGARDGA
jgi:phosphatidylglycerol---prolipoprotein diacylglyceryl transferase